MNKLFLSLSLFLCVSELSSQIINASRTGFTWIPTERVDDPGYGAGYSMYSAAWPIFKDYPGPSNFQMGLGSCWLSTQRTGNEPSQFYTTIEGGLGWWHDTRFGTKVPKFIMGGVSYNFHSWANGPGAGRSANLSNGQRDWSTDGGKYGVAQLSNRLLWAPDGLNMSQSLNGELLGYGYSPLPLTEVMEETDGKDIATGNQCWTLFLNTTNFKGPATFFLPTFWTEPVLNDPSIEGLFLDSRPSNPDIGFGIEHAQSPALMSSDENGDQYAKIARLQFPVSDENKAMVLNKVSVYSKDALWNSMEAWFNGASAVEPGFVQNGVHDVPFINNGGSMAAEIKGGGMEYSIDLDYIDNTQLTDNIMGFEFDMNSVPESDGMFLLPEYFSLDQDESWRAIDEASVPGSTGLLDQLVPLSSRREISYLTPLDPECQWQDPDGPWNNPGPVAGPFTTDMGDGTTLTYYWYRFVDQPAIIQADLPEDIRQEMQRRVELIHANWTHEDEYLSPPDIGNIATLDPGGIVEPPVGMEIGYVPIVSRQEKSAPKLRVFVLAGQSNMEGFGTVVDAEGDPGSLEHVIANDTEGEWSSLGTSGDWNVLEDAYIYFANNGDTIRNNVTVGQGNNPNLIGPELMFAYQLDEYYEDPVLIIKTAWGGRSLGEHFRPPSAGGNQGEYYDQIIDIVANVTRNLDTEFPDIGVDDYELSGFVWFQGWNDASSENLMAQYESNLQHLVHDIRADLGNTDLPVIIANSGHGGFSLSNDGWVRDMQTRISVAQENVACNDSMYGGRLGFVETKQFYKENSESPQDAIHHFNNNALTFLNIGKAMGDEMIRAINDMAFCYADCEQQIAPGIVSIGNRVWNDYNRNGINDPDEPGIPGVSLVIWSDSDGDDIPDWQGFGGVQVTDEDGYYSFSGLQPGYYLVFVWSVDNWGPGEPLEGFQSTNGFVMDADNDVDLDNNGSGNAFTDIKSGIVYLGVGEEPLNDGDAFNCYFDYDASGNNTIDFGFFNPDITSVIENDELGNVKIYPNPVDDLLILEGDLAKYRFELYDAMGRKLKSISTVEPYVRYDMSTMREGLYFLNILNEKAELIAVHKLIKH